MNKPIITGQGGLFGGSAKASSPVQGKDNLRSKATARLIDIISEGPILGLVAGAQSVLLTKIKMQEESGVFNYSNARIHARYGYPVQDPMPGISEVENQFTVGLTPKTRNQTLARIAVLDGGSGYTNATVQIVGGLGSPGKVGGNGADKNNPLIPTVNATAHAVIENGRIKAVVMDNIGANYIGQPTLTVTGDGSGAVLYPHMGGGSIYRITDEDVDAARVTIRLGQFYASDDKGNSADTQVAFHIQMRSDVEPDWHTAYSDSLFEDFTGNVTPYTQAMRIGVAVNIPAGQSYRVSVTARNRTLQTPATVIGTLSGYNNTDNAIVYRGVISALDLKYGEYEFTVTEENGRVFSVESQQFFSQTTPLTLIKGKTTSGYQESYRISLPTNVGVRELRLWRLTEDSIDQYLFNEVQFDSVTEIISSNVMYMDTAYVGVEVDSEYFNGSVPDRAYDVYGRIVRVPVNYEPTTRAYGDYWNGTFKNAYTNNPIWCFLDILTNSRYGLGQWVKDRHVNIGALYMMARYCDELVPNGKGGFEPRFTLNTQIMNAEEAYSVLNMLASVFRGMIYWSAGAIHATQDSPAKPSRTLTPSKVIGGDFSYVGVGKDAQHSVARVAWNDPENNHDRAFTVYEDPDRIQRYGYEVIDLVAYGCTSEAQAFRMGKWLIDSEKYANKIVSCRAGWDMSDLVPGEIINIADPSRAGVRQGGRIKAATATQITTDTPYQFEANQTYVMTVAVPTWGRARVTPGSNTIEGTRTLFQNAYTALAKDDIIIFDDEPTQYKIAVVNSNTSLTLDRPYTGKSNRKAHYSVIRGSVLVMSSYINLLEVPINPPGALLTDTVVPSRPMPIIPQPDSDWIVAASNVVPAQFRVQSIREMTRGQFEIVALEHDPNKYLRVEQGVPILPPKTFNIPREKAQPPRNPSAREGRAVRYGVPFSRISLFWEDGSAYNPSSGYYVSANTPDKGMVDFGFTVNQNLDIDNTVAGDYTFYIVALSVDGDTSSPTEFKFTATSWDGMVGPTISNLHLVNGYGTPPTNFRGLAPTVEWDAALPPDVAEYPLLFNLYVIDPVTDTVIRVIPRHPTKSYTYTYEQNYADAAGQTDTEGEGNPRRRVRIKVSAIDALGRESSQLSIVVENPPPEVILPDPIHTTETLYIEYLRPLDPDFAGIYAWVSLVQGFNLLTTPPRDMYDNQPVTFAGFRNKTVYIRIAGYDRFGKAVADLNISPEIRYVLSDTLFDPNGPMQPQGLALTTASETQADGTVTSIIRAGWSPPTGDDTSFGYHQISFGEGDFYAAGTEVSFLDDNVPAGQYTWERHALRPGAMYSVRLRSKGKPSVTGSDSAYTIVKTIRAALNNTPPLNPTNASVDAGFEQSIIRYTPSVTRDIKHIEVWAVNARQNSAAPPNEATIIGYVSARESQYWDATSLGTTHTYWLRAVNTSDVHATGFVYVGSATSAALVGAQLAANIIDSTKLATSIAAPIVVSALPTTKVSQFVTLASDGRLYRWDAGLNRYTTAIPAVDVGNGLTSEQIERLDATKIAGQLTDEQLKAISAGKLTGRLTSDQIDSLNAAKIAGQLTAAQLKEIEATKLIGKIVDDQIDALNAAKISGQVTDAQIAALSATKLAGKLTAAQIDKINAAQVAGQLTDAQIENINTTKLVGRIVSSQIETLNAAQIAGQLTSDQIRDLNATKIAGRLTNDQIENINSTKLVGKIVGDQIENLAITLEKFAIGTQPLATVTGLPNPVGYRGPAIVYNYQDGKLYRYHTYPAEAWVTSVTASDIAGQLAAGQIAALEASKITGQLSDTQLAGIAAAKIGGQLSSLQLSAIETTKLVGQIVDTQIANINAAKIAGRITAEQIDKLNAAQIAGQLSNEQVASLDATKLNGQIVADQLANAAITFAKFAPGTQPISIVTSLPAPFGYAGPKLVLNTTDAKIYRYLDGAWVSWISSDDILGQIKASQIAALEASKITGQLSSLQLSAIEAAKVSGQLSDTQLANISATKLVGKVVAGQIESLNAAQVAGQLTAAQIQSLNATQIAGTLSDAQLAGISASKLVGQLSNDQIASLNAAKIAGQLSNLQIAAIDAAKVSGQLTDAQIGALAANKLTGQVVAGQISSVNANVVSGQLSNEQIASLSAAKLSGQITGTQITDNAITTSKISSGSVTTASLAAYAVTASKLQVASDNRLINGDAAQGLFGFEWFGPNEVGVTEEWASSGYRSIMLFNNAPAQGSIADLHSVPRTPEGAEVRYVVSAGNWYELSAYVSAHRCTAQVYIEFLKADGTQAGIAGPGGNVTNNGAAGGPLKDFPRSWIIVQAPPGALYARPRFRMWNTLAGQDSTYTFWSAMQFCDAVAGQTEPSPYSTPGITTITGGSIRTNSLNANRIVAETITTNQIQAGGINADRLIANTITAREVSASAITADKIAARAISAREIAVGAITAEHVVVGSLTGDRITVRSLSADTFLAHTITGYEIKAREIGAEHIIAGTITATEIGANAITSEKISAGAITAREIASGAVTTNKLTVANRGINVVGLNTRYVVSTRQIQWDAGNIYYTDDAGVVRGVSVSGGNFTVSGSHWYSLLWAPGNTALVYTTDVNYGSVNPGWVTIATYDNGTGLDVRHGATIIDGDRIITNSINASRIIAGSITAEQIAGRTIKGANIVGETIGTLELAANAITAEKISAGAITAREIAADCITSREIAAATITSTEIQAGTIKGANLEVGTISALHIGVGSITGDRIQVRSLSADSFLAGTITAYEIGVGAIVADNIRAGTLTARQIAVRTLTGENIVGDSITGYEIRARTITAGNIAGDTITAHEIGANAITARAISAGAVSAREIAAGAIITSKLAVSSANQAYNPEFTQNTRGWTPGYNGMGGTGDFYVHSEYGQWAPTGFRPIVVNSNNSNPPGDGYMDINAGRARLDGTFEALPVNENQWYEFSACMSAHRCRGRIIAVWQNAAGGVTGYGDVSTVNIGGSYSGGSYRDFPKTWMLAQAPAGTTQVIVLFRGDNATAFSPHLFVSAFMFCVAPLGAAQKEPSPYVAPGQTTIDGGTILTDTIGARQVIAGSLTATEIQSRTITAEKIVGGAITGSEIAAYTITGTNVAVRTLSADTFIGGTITAYEIGSKVIEAGHIKARSIGAAEITVGALTALEISAGSITGDRIAARTINATNLIAGSITADEIAGGTITGSKIAGNTITGTQIIAGTIGTRELIANSITADQIASRTIRGSNIYGETIGTLELAAVCITAEKISVGAVIAEKIASGAVTTSKLVVGSRDFNITGLNIRYVVATRRIEWDGANIYYTRDDGLLDGRTIDAGGFTVSGNTWYSVLYYPGRTTLDYNSDINYAKNNPGWVTIATYDNGTGLDVKHGSTVIDGERIVTNSIYANRIVARSITAEQIATGVITANEIMGRTITGEKIVGNTITATEIAVRTIKAANIEGGAISAYEIATGAITAEKVSAGAITARELAVGSITASKLQIASMNLAIGADNGQNVYPYFLEDATGVATISGDNADWSPMGMRSICVFWPGRPSHYTDLVMQPKAADGVSNRYIPVREGMRLEVSCYISSHRCTGTLYIRFLRADGVWFEGRFMSGVTDIRHGTGSPLSAWNANGRSKGFVTVPVGVSFASVMVRGEAFTGNDPYMFVSGIMVAEADPNQTEISPYVDPTTVTITGGSIVGGTLMASKMVAGTLTSREIQSRAITADRIGTNVLTASEIAAASITGDRMSVRSMNANVIYGYSITGYEIAAREVTAEKIVGGSITAYEIAAASITGSRISARTLTAANIDAGTITAFEIAAGTITADRIKSDEIQGYLIRSNTLESRHIIADAITTSKIAAGAIGANQIAASAITADKIGVGLSTGNLMWNADFAFDRDYPVYTNMTGWSQGRSDYWSLTGTFARMLFIGSGQGTNKYAVTDFEYPTADGGWTVHLPVQGGVRYEISAYLSVHRCRGHVELLWHNAEKQHIGTAATNVLYSAGARGAPVDNWRAACMAVAPGNAEYVTIRMVVYGTNEDAGYLFGSGFYFAVSQSNQIQYSPFAVQSRTVISGGQIATNSLNANKIVAGSITTDRLAAYSINADRFEGTSLKARVLEVGAVTADTITVGNGNLSTLISGTNATKINGSSISANSIRTNQLQVGMRGVNVTGLNLRYIAATRRIEWDAGTIYWVDDNGNAQGTNIPANGFTVSGNNFYAIIWHYTRNYLDYVTDINYGVVNTSWVTLATYDNSYSGFVVNYGATFIDGDRIVTNSIKADRIAANQIQTEHMAAGTIRGDRIATSSLSADRISAGVITAGTINIGSGRFALESSGRRMRIFGTNGAEFVCIGDVGPWTGAADDTNYGIIIRDFQNQEILSVSGNTARINGLYIQAATIGSASIQDAAITNAKIGNLEVTNAKIQNLTIGNGKMGTGQVSTLLNAFSSNNTAGLNVFLRDGKFQIYVYMRGNGGATTPSNSGIVTGALRIWAQGDNFGRTPVEAIIVPISQVYLPSNGGNHYYTPSFSYSVTWDARGSQNYYITAEYDGALANQGVGLFVSEVSK